MTSIPEMSNQELDRKIAELREPIPAMIDKISWSRYEAVQNELHADYGTANWRVTYNPITFMGDVERGWAGQRFTTDPRYAMELLEEMKEDIVFIVFDSRGWTIMLNTKEDGRINFSNTDLKRVASEAFAAYAQMKEGEK